MLKLSPLQQCCVLCGWAAESLNTELRFTSLWGRENISYSFTFFCGIEFARIVAVLCRIAAAFIGHKMPFTV